MAKFKELLAGGRLVRVFAMGRLIHPVTIDMFGIVGGFDGFWLDQEHAGLTYDQVLVASVCARANSFDCFVRIAPTDYALVTQNLEAGAGGVMAARIDSVDQARDFVSWAKFAPQGNRGFNTQGRDADYTFKPPIPFSEDANRDQLVAVQIETLGALNQADEIAALAGVDMLFVGPSDLSQALGVLGQLGHPTVWEAIDRVSAACRRHGKPWATIAVDPQHVDRCIEKGCRMMSFGSEVHAFRMGLGALKTTYGKHF